MSDDQTEKPKKLRLSRDTHENSRADESDALDAHPSATASSPLPEPKSPGEVEESKAQKSKLRPSHQPDQPSQPVSSDPTGNLHGSAGSTKGQSESAGSPPLAEPTARPADSPLPPQEKSHSVLPSLIVAGLLFLLLGGAGFGLWKILSTDEPARTVDSQEPDEAHEVAKARNPIERAKESIATVLQLDMDDHRGKTKGAGKTTVPVEGNSSANASLTGEAVIEEAESPGVRAARNAAVEATKAAVSEFLGALHIGGMRRGESPIILIDGRVHNVGDTVQAETGLKFDGIRNGKLAFIDQNDIVYLKTF